MASKLAKNVAKLLEFDFPPHYAVYSLCLPLIRFLLISLVSVLGLYFSPCLLSFFEDFTMSFINTNCLLLKEKKGKKKRKEKKLAELLHTPCHTCL